MIKLKFSKKYHFLFILCFLGVFFYGSISEVKAQYQDFSFSGNDPESYQCFTLSGKALTTGAYSTGVSDVRDPTNGYFLCKCYAGSNTSSDWDDPQPASFTNDPVASGGSVKCPSSGGSSAPDGDIRAGMPGNSPIQAVLKPVKLQQIEIWFVKILYVVWAIIGSLSFFYLIVLGYQYMITRGDVTKITTIRKKIMYYIIGLVLVFLAVPILTTTFRLMGINDNVKCYNVNMPGFQFFFAELCTDPQGKTINQCDDITARTPNFSINSVSGIACTAENESVQCEIGDGYGVVRYTCIDNYWQVTYVKL